MTDPSRVVVCIPTYNEADNVARMMEAVARHGYHVLVVDDASPDGTGLIADRVAAAHPRMSVVRRSGKNGLGSAYVAGFEKACAQLQAEIVCQMDCDFSHDPSDLPRLVAAVEEGSALAIGSRYVRGGSTSGWSLARRMLSVVGNRYASLLLGTGLRDMTSGFRAFDAGALRCLDPASCNATGYAFQVEMAYRAWEYGLRVAELPIVFRERTRGESKMSWRIAMEAVMLVTRWGVARRCHRRRIGAGRTGRVPQRGRRR